MSMLTNQINKIFILINLVLLTIGVHMGVKGFYRIVTGNLAYQVPETNLKQIPAFQTDRAKPLSYYRVITERNLFQTGKEQALKKNPVDIDLDAMQETDLKLKLWGTVTGNQPYAVIEDLKERKQNLYRVGDSLQNAVVKMVLREKVVLSVNGRDEVLKIEESQSGQRGRVSSRSRPSPGIMRPVSKQRITLRKSQIENAMANVTELMGQAKIRPHFENGKPDGLTLSRVKPRSIFRRMGLRNGDIITGVDGNAIETVDDALRFYDNLTNASNVTLQLKRRGREKIIEYTIK